MENPTNLTPDPYKDIEFKEFIAFLEDGDPIESWEAMANAIGVSRDTIWRWKKTPEAKLAILKGIRNALKEMKKAGGDDWRMWREYVKIMGIKDVTTIEGGLNLDAVVKRVESDYEDFARKTERQMVENEPPVQDKG